MQLTLEGTGVQGLWTATLPGDRAALLGGQACPMCWGAQCCTLGAAPRADGGAQGAWGAGTGWETPCKERLINLLCSSSI